MSTIKTALRATTAAVVLGLGATMMSSAPASAMTVAEQKLAYSLRATYYSQLNAARANYNASKLDYPLLPTGYTSAYSTVMTTTTKRVAAIAAQLSAARTLTQYYAVAPKVRAELARSKAHRATVHLAADAITARKSAIAADQAAARAFLADTMSYEKYSTIAEASGRVAALASADLLRMWGALGKSVIPAKAVSTTWVPALDGSTTVPETAGFTAIPGSCALPTADAAWLGNATEPGLHQWISDADVNAARARLANKDSVFLPVHESLMRQASKITGASLAPSDLRLAGQRLGYSWLVTDNSTARTMLTSAAMSILTAGPTGRGLTDASALEAASTSLDWVNLGTAERQRATVAMRDLWLSPFTCLIEDRMGMRDANNMAAIYNAALFQAGLYIAPSDPATGAALARSSWTNMQPAIAAMADGGWYEGPAYWNLMGRALAGAISTAQNVYGASASTATGSVVTLPDLTNTASFLWDASDSRGLVTTFSDSTNDALRDHYASLLLRTTDNADAMTAFRARTYTAEAYQALWWPSAEALAAPEPAKVSTLFPTTGLAALQSGTATAWLKGSSRLLSHTHLDAGSVTLTARGVQWSIDPGKGDYTASGYFLTSPTSPRWNYFQVSQNAHSSVTSTRPVLAASTPMTVVGNTAGIDLHSALATTTATRTVALASTRMTVKDSLTAATARVWTWRWVTEASVAVGGTSVDPRFTLTQADANGATQRMVLTVDGVPAGSTVAATRTSTVSANGKPITVITITTPAQAALALTATATW